MEKEFLVILRDYVQDTRVNARKELKYDALIRALIENTRLNYSKNDLRIDDDKNVIIALLKAFEPDEYAEQLNDLLEEDYNKEQVNDDDIPF